MFFLPNFSFNSWSIQKNSNFLHKKPSWSIDHQISNKFYWFNNRNWQNWWKKTKRVRNSSQSTEQWEKKIFFYLENRNSSILLKRLWNKWRIIKEIFQLWHTKCVVFFSLHWIILHYHVPLSFLDRKILFFTVFFGLKKKIIFYTKEKEFFRVKRLKKLFLGWKKKQK